MSPRRYGWSGYWDWYEPTTPVRVKGGIRSQSTRGAFGESWWAKRWTAVLDDSGIGSRLGRGRTYARKGQVLSIDVAKGEVRAKVQGSRPTPYRATIGVRVLAPDEWERVVAALAGQAIFSAKLLAGEMPHDIEEVFRAAGVSLFPERSRDLETDCSCPDWSNPCKHVAAVYYLLGEEFDRDPFLIFTLRGMTRDELVGRLGAIAAPKTRTRSARRGPRPKPEPLASDPAIFWGGRGSVPDDLLGEVRTPPVAAALPRRLGGFPFWRGAEPLVDAVEPSYTRASDRALDLLARETESVE